MLINFPRSSPVCVCSEELSVGMKIIGLLFTALAVIIVVGGSIMLHENQDALTAPQQCNQLYVWSLLFVIFEGIYLGGMTLHWCFSDESFHTRRVKSLILLIVFCMSVLFFCWGTAIINDSECPEERFRSGGTQADRHARQG